MYQGDFNRGNIILHFLFLLLPAILGAIYVYRQKPRDRIEVYLLFYVVISIGIQGLVAGIWQICAAYRSPPLMGWPYNPHLFELGMANLAFAVLGVMSIWRKEQWRAATALGYALFLFLSALGHLINMPFIHKRAAGQGGATLWTDVLLAIVFFVLLGLRRHRMLHPK